MNEYAPVYLTAEVITAFKVCMGVREPKYIEKIFNMIGAEQYRVESNSTGGHYGRTDFHITAYVADNAPRVGVKIYKRAGIMHVMYGGIDTVYCAGGPGVDGEKRLRKMLDLAKYVDSLCPTPTDLTHGAAGACIPAYIFLQAFKRIKDKYLYGAMTLQQVKDLIGLQQSIGGAV
jgi:hypothetical protein